MNNLTESWDDNEFPQAYLITFRTYGTWLHGDDRGSVDVHGKNRFGSPRQRPEKKLQNVMNNNRLHAPLILNEIQRLAVHESIVETCNARNYLLFAINVRSNHVHTVIHARSKPDIVMNGLKSHATRKLRGSYLTVQGEPVWSKGGSKRYLWKKRSVDLAIDYVLYGQGNLPFEIE